MFDLRPSVHVIGLWIMATGLVMLVPMALDFSLGNYNQAFAFAISAFISCLFGGIVWLACANCIYRYLSIQQTFFLISGVWIVVPIFAALPFIFGATEARFVDAFFETMSGWTTTGATVFEGLNNLPAGLLLWRALLQWFGGIAIVIVAIVFWPLLRVGGMQIFHNEGFDTFGKILPRIADISRSTSVVYIVLTLACMAAYFLVDLSFFDALTHAMTTIATGGFSNYDESFAALSGAPEYIATFFMILSALPLMIYTRLWRQSLLSLLNNSQIKVFLLTALGIVVILTFWQIYFLASPIEFSLRKAMFNGISILTGTGYVSDDYMLWGNFPIIFFFFIGLIGGCAGSTTCSIRIFRFQLLFASIRTQIQSIHNPSGIFQPCYNHKPVPEDVISSVMAFFVLFVASLVFFAIALEMSGLDIVTSISGAASALANIGPGLGAEIGPVSNFSLLNDAAKWLLSLAMLVGRLELMAVYILFTYVFWKG